MKRIFILIILVSFLSFTVACGTVTNNEIYNKSYNVNVDIETIGDAFVPAIEIATEATLGVGVYAKVSKFELYWEEAASGSCVVYETVAHFRTFGVKCFVFDESPKVTKFDAKSQEGIFIGYAKISRAYRVFIPSQKTVVESVHVKFDENTNLVVEKGNENAGDEQA